MAENDQDLDHSNDRLIQVSKFLSFVLRHRPDAIGLTLDSEGWVSISELIKKSKSQIPLSHETINVVVSTSDKQRFSISGDGLRIRANQGHSVEVDLGLKPQQPPRILYHGTAERHVPAIQTEGLHAGQRQYVHLSVDTASALAVGKRYGKPVVLRVDSASMQMCGHEFFLSKNGIWLTERVPPKFLTETQ